MPAGCQNMGIQPVIRLGLADVRHRQATTFRMMALV
jgi:hypothetical protein